MSERWDYKGATPIAGIGLIVVGACLMVASFVPSVAEATQPNPDHKVTLCHRTDSYSNPYVVITVDVASVLHQHGHHGHDGPIFWPAIPKHTKWGDIIPQFNYGPGEQYGGKNWTGDGQAILRSGCTLPAPTTTTTSTTTTVTASTTTTVPSTGTTTTIPSNITTTTLPPSETTTTVPSTTTTTVSGATTSTVVIEGSTTSVPGATTTLAPGSNTTSTTAKVNEQGGTSTTTVAAGASPSATQTLASTGARQWPLLMAGLVLIGAGTGLVVGRRRRATS